jgi:hypothetical protein
MEARARRPVPPVPRDAKFISIRQLCERYGDVSQMWVERKLRRMMRSRVRTSSASFGSGRSTS